MNEMNQQQQQQQQLMKMNPNLMSLNQLNPHQPQQPPPQMVPMNRSYGMWAPPPPPQFQNPNPSAGGSIKPPPSGFSKSLGPRSNWKGKKVNNNNDKRRKDQPKPVMLGPGGGGSSSSVVNPSYSSYQPPMLNELQHQNRLKTRKFFPKKKFNKNNNNAMNANMNMSGNVKYFKNSRSAPFAPRNTSSFLIRAKKSGGIASLVSPCPVTPAVLPTPIFSPSKEVLVDMAKEEWGVDGYGSMKGLIRLRSPGHEMEPNEEDDDEGGSSESDVEEHVEVERRLDHDLSRFEMIYDPVTGIAGGMEYHNVLENRVDDQDSHIAQLEEENLILKERLFLMERELGDLRRRMQSLERRNRGEEFNEEVVENDSENDSGSREEAHSMEDNTGDFSEDNIQGDGYGCSKVEGYDGEDGEHFKAAMTTEEKCLVLDNEGKLENNENAPIVANKNSNSGDVEAKDENNNDQVTGLDKNENNNNEGTEANKSQEIVTAVEDVEGKLKSEDYVGVGSSDLPGDVQMEEVGTANDKIAPEN